MSRQFLFLALLAASTAVASAEPVVKAQVRTVDRIYAADAVIESTLQASVAAQLNGRILAVGADAGDRVRKGQVLARIDTREADASLASADAQVAQAQAQLFQARQNFERTRDLRAQNFVSQAALDSAQAGLKSAEATVDAARAGVHQAGTVRSFAEVTAPFDGIVASRSAEIGDFAAQGKTLFVVYAPGSLRAAATVPQALVGDLGHARAAAVEVPSLDKSLVAGKLTVLPAADARSLSQRVRVDLPRPEQAIPGMAAKVNLVIGSAQRLVIPADAVIHRGELTAVQVIGADGKKSLRQVRLGERFAGGLVEVLAGVQAGEQVNLPAGGAATTTAAPAASH